MCCCFYLSPSASRPIDQRIMIEIDYCYFTVKMRIEYYFTVYVLIANFLISYNQPDV